MKGATTIHDPGNPQQFVLPVSESENVMFSVAVKQLKLHQSKLIQRCRIVFLTIKEFMIVMCGALILTIIVLWTFNSRDNDLN